MTDDLAPQHYFITFASFSWTVQRSKKKGNVMGQVEDEPKKTAIDFHLLAQKVIPYF